MVERAHGQQSHTRNLEAGVISGARIFMEASLTRVEVWDLDADRDRRIATWLFSLGAVDALSKLTHLDHSASLEAAVDFFSCQVGIDTVAAAMLVASLQEICEDGGWAELRDGGEKAMVDWLTRADEQAPARLRDMLDTTLWPTRGGEAAAILSFAAMPTAG